MRQAAHIHGPKDSLHSHLSGGIFWIFSGSEKNRWFQEEPVKKSRKKSGGAGLLVKQGIFNLCFRGSWGDLSVTTLLVDPLLEDLHIPSVPSEFLPQQRYNQNNKRQSK